jgi:hypothetical protein
MHCVHRTSNRTEAYLLCGALETQGVAARVDEPVVALPGRLPAGFVADLRVCILDDEQLPVAQRFVRAWLEGHREPGGEPWVCDGCGEEHGAQFSACWRCGRDRDAA